MLHLACLLVAAAVDLSGIVTVLNTPFRHDGYLDTHGLAKNVEVALAARVRGFLVPAKAAEVDSLSLPERETMVRTVVTTVKTSTALAEKPPVIICGVYASEPDERLRYVARWSQLNCSGVLLNVAYKGDDLAFEAAVVAVANALPAGMFLQLQDLNFTGTGLPLDLVLQLWRRLPSSFISIKIETVNAAHKASLVLHATAGPRQLNVATGWAVTSMVQAFDRGVTTVMPTAMHALYTGVYELYFGRTPSRAPASRERVACLHSKMLRVLVFSNSALNVSIVYFKQLLHTQSVYSTPLTRIAPDPLDTWDRREAGGWPINAMPHAAPFHARAGLNLYLIPTLKPR